MHIPINPQVKEILTRINEQGYEAYLVGGAIRDTLLGLPSKDFDICTNMPLDKVKELYPRFHIMKPNQHRTTGIMRIDGIDFEISEFKGNTLEEDLSNRDFTINAIAQDINGNIIDYHNGIEALKTKTISLIKRDGQAFKDNPGQILRAIRIASKLNFEIDENCHTQMIYKKRLLEGIAPERIYRELIQILISDKPSKYIRDNLDVIFIILPELKPMYNFEQNNRWHIYDVLEHTLVALDNTERNIFLRIATLFHDVGKPSKYFEGKDGVGHFYGHPEKSEEIFLSIAKRLKIDNKTKELVSKLIKNHDMSLSSKTDKIYEFIKKYGFDYIILLFALKRADNLAQNRSLSDEVLKELAELEVLYRSYMLKCNNLQVNSQKISELGYSKQRIKLILSDVERKVVIDELPNEEQILVSYINNKYRRQ